MTKKRFKPIYIIAILLLFVFNANSFAASKGGRTAADFLLLNFGAKPSSMGGAFSAVASGAYALHWNPAGLTETENTEVTIGHFSLYQDLNLEYGAFSRNINDKVYLGGSILYLGYGTINGYNTAGEPTGDIDAYDFAGGLSLGYRLSEEIVSGISVKIINQKLDDISASTVAFDFGAKYIFSKGILALTVKNIGPKLKFETVEERLPMTVVGGIAYPLYNNKVLAAIDIERRVYGTMQIKSGFEYNHQDKYFLRSGFSYNLDQEDRTLSSGINFGAGVKLNQFVIDYAITFKEKYNSEFLHQFSLSFLSLK